MASIFEELMTQNRQLTESVIRANNKSVKIESNAPKKINIKKLKFESKRIFEDADLDELDKEFAVDPEESAEDEVVLVIDPEAPADEEIPEEAGEDMIGDFVYKCPICGANYVCDCDASKNEALEVDEEGVPVECPICGDDAEQILIGEIAPAEGMNPEDEHEMPPVDAEKPEEEEEIEEKEEEEEIIEDSIKRRPRLRRESTMRRRPIRRRRTESKVYRTMPKRRLREDFEEDVVEFEPIEPVAEEEKPAVKIDTDVVNLTIDEHRFESLMRKMIRENFKSSPRFKIDNAVADRGTFRFAYTVAEAQKKSRRGILIAEGYNARARKFTLSVRDKGVFTESITKRPAFMVECVKVGKQIVPVSLRYNFTKKVNESLYRISGSVKLAESVRRPSKAIRRTNTVEGVRKPVRRSRRVSEGIQRPVRKPVRRRVRNTEGMRRLNARRAVRPVVRRAKED